MNVLRGINHNFKKGRGSFHSHGRSNNNTTAKPIKMEAFLIIKSFISKLCCVDGTVRHLCRQCFTKFGVGKIFLIHKNVGADISSIDAVCNIEVCSYAWLHNFVLKTIIIGIDNVNFMMFLSVCV